MLQSHNLTKMAFHAAYRSLLPSCKNFLPILQYRIPTNQSHRFLHVTPRIFGTTHTVEVQTYPIEPEQLDKLIEENPLPKIRQLTKTVVKIRDDVLDEDEKVKKELLLVGHANRLKGVQSYLNAFFYSEEEPKLKFMPQDYKLIWQGYRRNFKGQFVPKKPRKKCIRYDRVLGNPCPMCQLKLESDYDIDFTDVEILEHFISPHTNEILSTVLTGLCRKQHERVVACIEKARLYGYLPFTLPLPSDEPKKHVPAGVPTDRMIKYKIN